MMTEPPVAERSQPEWHARAAAAVLAELDSSPAGLAGDEAARRGAAGGPNALPAPPPRPAWRRLLGQFNNLLIHVLLAAGVAAALLDHAIDAAVIFAVVLINGLIGFVQEGRAERAMEAIGGMLAPRARARRDGGWQRIDATGLVVGDVVLLKAGDKVPADLRLIDSHGLRVEQAALTGESVPVGKRVGELPPATPLAERACMAYAGTLVAAGQGSGVVVAIGRATELGHISALLERVDTLTTPLLREIARFAQWLTVITLVLAGLMVLAAALLHDMDPVDGFLAGVALAVAAIPEGLPAIISITLAIGVQRMGRRNAVIRRLPAVETLGAVSTICSDKTGTLTRNELVASDVVLASGALPADRLHEYGAAARGLLETAVLASDAHPGATGGDPLEHALVELAAAAGVDVEALRDANPRDALLPFSSELKLMASLHGDRLCVKGAPERVIDRCDRQRGTAGPVPIEPAAWQGRLGELAAAGLRVLAIAERSCASGEIAARGALPIEDGPHSPEACPGLDLTGLVAGQLELLGLVAFIDPPRPEVAAALQACRTAGIAVKMITGDHVETASAIARQLGIVGRAPALTGPQLDAMADHQLADAVERVAVFARTSPEHKLRLVSALQARGQVVAMTGDGANDAPALKRADIGVAMGIKGTEASRQAAEMVLADDNFATIVAGVEEGRGVYDNIRKALMFILPTNAAEAMVILLAVSAGLALPITPVQILWINMATAITLALALAFEPLEAGVMRRPPRPMRRGLVTPYVGWRILWVGVVLTLASFGLFLVEMGDSGDEALARTAALNMLVAGELVYLFNCRRWVAPGYTREALFANPWAWGSVGMLLLLQGALTYWPPLQRVFGTVGLGLWEWLWIAVLALTLFVLVELEKAGRRALRARAAARRAGA
jgi:magnesium-transporting ATPase (P-type)